MAVEHGGQGADHAMQVSSSGTADLLALVMFVVDADKPAGYMQQTQWPTKPYEAIVAAKGKVTDAVMAILRG